MSRTPSPAPAPRLGGTRDIRPQVRADDLPGVDGRALIRIRVTNESAEDVVVDGGSWQVVADGETVGEGDLVGGSELPIDGTWEQVVQIPGGTGPAVFSASIDVTGNGGTSTFDLDPIDVPGDCPQPEASTTTEATMPAAEAAPASPRFTG